jgi:3-carboxy-cis,cis-muconate cycloisomerase
VSSGALAHTRGLIADLEIDPVRMRANLDLTKGLMLAGAVRMALAPHLGRQRAHDLVQKLCRRTTVEARSLLDLLAEHAEVAPHLDRAALAHLLDPANYLGLSGAMVDRVLAGLRPR